MTNFPLNPRHRRGGVAALLWAALFALAYGQAPLFTSNQHQYFLHGMAQAGVGQLAADWLANTLDPTPVFTALVVFAQPFLPSAAFCLD